MRIAPLAVAVVLVLTGAVTGPTRSSYAVALEPTTASQTVTALGNFTECFPASAQRIVDQQQNGDGTSSPFVVPARHVFVVTSFEFSFAGATASQYVPLPLVVYDAALTSVAYVSIASAVADSTGRGGGAVVLPSGFPVKPGTRLCFQFPTPATGAVIVHGFMAADR